MRIRETKIYHGGANMERVLEVNLPLTAGLGFSDNLDSNYTKIYEGLVLLTQVPYHGALILEAIEDNNDTP